MPFVRMPEYKLPHYAPRRKCSSPAPRAARFCPDSAHDPLEVFCIQVHALETMSARLRLAVHPSTL
jgi:hypothetical protein